MVFFVLLLQILGEHLDQSVSNHQQLDDALHELSDWLNDRQYDLDQCCQITPDKPTNQDRLNDMKVS